MALDTNAIDSSTVPPTRHRSILSKLTSRFGNRNRNISEFYVQPDDPWKSYHPGEIVKGAVVLTVVKPVRITHLVVFYMVTRRSSRTRLALVSMQRSRATWGRDVGAETANIWATASPRCSRTRWSCAAMEG